MINGIVLAALGGAAGGAAGAALGRLIEKRRGLASSSRSRSTTVLGVLLAVVGARSAPLLFQPSIESQLDQASPMFATLHRYYPAQYATAVAAAKSKPSDPVALHNEVAPIVGGIVKDHRGQMDDDSARRLVATVLVESRALRQRDPRSCVTMITQGTSAVDLSSVMTPEIKTQDAENTQAILEQVATRPAAPPQPLSTEQKRRLAQGALAGTPADERDVVTPLLASSGQPSTAAKAAALCDFDIALFQNATASGPGVLRALLASG